MDKERIKGAADKAAGSAKSAIGKMTGDSKLRAEGQFDKAKGAGRDAIGSVKDAARKGAHDAKRETKARRDDV